MPRDSVASLGTGTPSSATTEIPRFPVAAAGAGPPRHSAFWRGAGTAAGADRALRSCCLTFQRGRYQGLNVSIIVRMSASSRKSALPQECPVVRPRGCAEALLARPTGAPEKALGCTGHCPSPLHGVGHPHSQAAPPQRYWRAMGWGGGGGMAQGFKGKKVRDAKTNERSQGRSLLHGQDRDKTQHRRRSIEQWLAVGGGWRWAAGGGGCP